MRRGTALHPVPRRNRTWDHLPMHFLRCQLEPTSPPPGRRARVRCDLLDFVNSKVCNDFFDFCDANDGDNWDLPSCTPPCELLDNPDTDARCKDPDDQ